MKHSQYERAVVETARRRSASRLGRLDTRTPRRGNDVPKPHMSRGTLSSQQSCPLRSSIFDHSSSAAHRMLRSFGPSARPARLSDWGRPLVGKAQCTPTSAYALCTFTHGQAFSTRLQRVLADEISCAPSRSQFTRSVQARPRSNRQTITKEDLRNEQQCQRS